LSLLHFIILVMLGDLYKSEFLIMWYPKLLTCHLSWIQIFSWAHASKTLVIHVFGSRQGMAFHIHTKQLAQLLFCVSWCWTFWKLDRMITVFELDGNKHFHNVFLS
jgi:hypothetical protein